MAPKKGSIASFAAGAIAGCIDTCITMPLDTIKTKMQIQKTPFFTCTSNILKSDGALGFYNGFPSFCFQASGKAAVRFFMFDVLTKSVDRMGIDRSKNNSFWNFTCGVGAGMCEALFWTTPTERLKVLQQAAAGSGKQALGTMQLIQQQGFSGIYVGALPTAMRQATSVAVRFTLFDIVKDILFKLRNEDRENASMTTNFLAGGAGGAVSVVLNNPIDVIKSRVQSGHSKNMMQAFSSVMKESGITGFGAGLSARVPRLFLSQAIQFTLVDYIKRNVF